MVGAKRFDPGELVTWQGWDAVVVDVDFERKYTYRLEIEEVSGRNFTILALPGEVIKRSVFSKRYTSTLAVAICQVEAEDQDRRRQAEREAEAQWAMDSVQAALEQTERELRWMQAYWWMSLAVVSLVGFILGVLSRR